MSRRIPIDSLAQNSPKEVIHLAESFNKREQNYEIKYLRKALGQVDKRIQVPPSLDASSLRPLLDNVAEAAPRELTSRRPRWLSLQSGIAYAAAFALIVALFYSMEFYKPDIIHGGMSIVQSEQPPQPEPGVNVTESQSPDAPAAEQILFIPESTDTQADPAPEAELATVESAPAAEAFNADDNIGGSGKATLLLEQEERAYYWRKNDITDPDVSAILTLEIIDTGSQELVTQVNMSDILEIDRCFVLEDMILVVGKDEDGVAVRAYSGMDSSEELAELFADNQPGGLIDVRVYKDMVHIASMSDAPDESGEVITLPYTEETDSCIITAINLDTFDTARKSFVGAKGTVQLHNLNAYIHYEGTGEDDSQESYIGQILFDGMDMDLGTVS